MGAIKSEWRAASSRNTGRDHLGIRTLVLQTTTKGRSVEEYRDDLIGRLGALIEAENFAFDVQRSTDLKSLVEHILAPYSQGSNAVAIEPGIAVELTPRQITSLSMVLHEMATNAAKYGALSAPGGQVRVSWMVEGLGNNLTLNWVESGGPPATAPQYAGFGTTLIESTISYSLHGRVELDYSTEGFRAEIVIPLGGVAPQD